MIRFINDPFKTLIKAANNLYPSIRADVQFRPDMKHKKIFCFQFGKCGCTTFQETPEDGSVLIDISTNIPFTAMVEILAHELAHAVTPEDDNHGEAWEKAFTALHAEYEKVSKEKAESEATE